MSTFPVNISERLTFASSKLIKFRSNWLLSYLAVPFLFLIVLWFVLGDIVGDPYTLPGTDTYWHVAQIDEAHDRLKAGEPIGPISETMNGGITYLYDTDRSYPQFGYLVSLAVSIFTGDAGVTYGLLMYVASAVAQLTFYFGFRSRFGHVGAAFGALVFAYSPFTLTSIAPQGRYPALLAVSTLPGAMAGLLAILDRPSRFRWVITTLAVGTSVAFHAMVFYIAAIPIAIIAGLYALSNRVATFRILLAISATVAGILTVWILLPDGIADLAQRGGIAGVAASSDGPGVRASTGANSQILPFSIRWNSFDAALRLSNENYAGIGIVVASAIAALMSKSRQVLIFSVGSITAYLLATGSLTPLWDKVPLAAQLEPRRFLFPAYLAAAMVIAAGTGRMVRLAYEDRTARSIIFAAVPLVVIAGLVAYDAIPMIRRITPDDGYEKAWAETLNQADVDGRLFWNSHRDFSPYYFVGRESSIATIGRLEVVDASIRDGFVDRALAELALYNTRAVITDSVAFAPLVTVLEDAGFEQLGTWGTQVLLAWEEPGSLFMNQTRDVGLFGVAASQYWAHILPNSIPITNPADISPEYLASFRMIVLSAYDIPNIEKAETALQTYMENGGLVVFEEPNRSNKNLFGAEHVLKDVPEKILVNGVDGPREVKPFGIGGGRFAGAFYEDAGEIVLSGTSDEEEIIPLVQKEKVGLGAMYWVCCNVGNHTLVNPGRDLALADEMNKYFASEIGGFRSIWPTQLEEEITQTGPSTFQISYSSEVPIPVLISMRSSSKRSLLDEDGNSIELKNVGSLTRAVLPDGSHVLTLGTNANPFVPTVVFVWLTGLVVGAVVLTQGWQLLSKSGPSTEQAALIGLRRYLTPKRVGEIQFPDGKLEFGVPRSVDKHEELGFAPSQFLTFTPISESDRLIVLNVEIKSSSSTATIVPISDFRLHTSQNETVVSMQGVQLIESLKNSSLISSLDIRQPLLVGDIELEPESSVLGFMVFALSTESGVEGISHRSGPDSVITF